MIARRFYFQTKNPDFDIFGKAFKWKILLYLFYEQLVYSVTFFNILWSFWYVFPGFSMWGQDKSGNPATE
jgi:hypothetical protein